MRIAACIDLVPRKLGSLEQWVVMLGRECKARGHYLHLYWREPVFPTIAQRLEALGIGWTPLEEVESAPFAWSRRFRREYDVIYLNLVIPRSRVAFAAYLAWPIPVLYFDQISGPFFGGPRRSLASRVLDPLAFRRVAGVAGCSDYVTRRDRLRFAVPPERSVTIYNGSDPEVFRPGPPRNGTAPTLLSIAYLIPEKGLDILLRACALNQDLPWRLVVTGDGPEAARLQTLADDLGLSQRVELTGFRSDVASLMQTAEIFVHPAIWEEAFGLTITEAMASECPIIASRIGGIGEIVVDGETGLLVPPADVEALAGALRHLLTSPEQRRSMGIAARRRVLEKFTLRSSVIGQLDWIERGGSAK